MSAGWFQVSSPGPRAGAVTLEPGDVMRAVMAAYEQLCGRSLAIQRVMAWHVLSVPGLD